MVKIYKSNYRQRMKHFDSVYFLFGGLLFVVVFAIYKFGIQDLSMYLKIMLVPFILFILPTLYIHLEYYFTNRNDILKIDDAKNGVEHTHMNKTIDFDFNDITSIEQFKTPIVFEKRASWVPWDTYNYTKILLNNQEQIFITCHMIDEFDLPIVKEKKKEYVVWLPYLRR